MSSSRRVRPFRESMDIARWIWTHPSNRGRRLRQLGRAVVFQVRGRVFRRPTLTRIGKRSSMWAELHAFAASKVLYANPPDVPEMLVWRAWLRPGDLFVDAGANVGTYALYAAEREAHVIAVEPNSGVYARLLRNISLNDYAIQTERCALAEAEGTRWMTTGKDTTNRLTDASTHGAVEVPVRTLDSLLGDRTARGIKLDVEGAEWLVLRGAENALREQRIELMQIEWNTLCDAFGYSRNELADWLRSLGYGLCVAVSSGQLVPRLDTNSSITDVFARPLAAS